MPTADAIEAVGDWLIAQALAEGEFEAMYEGCCERLLAAGVPLWRAHVAFTILHPLYSGMGMTWMRGDTTTFQTYAYRDGRDSDPFRVSPLYHIIENRLPLLRRRITGEDAQIDFPILEELREEGATDYLAFLLPFGSGELNGMVGSWATDAPAGFTDGDIQALTRMQQHLGVACKMRIKDRIATNVVTTYMGADAGLRVLAGQIRRGDGETIRAVLWYSDMRNSTGLADALPREAFIQALNTYFECTGGAVNDEGGEILNFIGDAVLAIFPIAEGRSTVAEACRAALAASREAAKRLAAANAERETKGAVPLSFGLGLHVGEVLFGNIGIPERVSFSVIGSAVNEVARLEALTKELGHPVLASEDFARNAGADWTRLGRHKLRGVGEPIEVLAPAGDGVPA